MDGAIQRYQGAEIFSLNIDDLDVDELERRLEMAVANPDAAEICGVHKTCNCPNLGSCGTYCSRGWPASAGLTAGAPRAAPAAQP